MRRLEHKNVRIWSPPLEHEVRYRFPGILDIRRGGREGRCKRGPLTRIAPRRVGPRTTPERRSLLGQACGEPRPQQSRNPRA